MVAMSICLDAIHSAAVIPVDHAGQSTSLDSGTILFQTVRNAIDELPVPPDQSCTSTVKASGHLDPRHHSPISGSGLTNQADGALWAGPPATISAYWQQISAMSTSGADLGSDRRGTVPVIRFAANVRRAWHNLRACGVRSRVSSFRTC